MGDLATREFGEAPFQAFGPAKPLAARAFATYSEARRARHALPPPAQSTLDSVGGLWWVYAWHPEALGALLRANALVLRRAGWPVRAGAFVKRVRKKRVRPKTPLYDLVADAYGDKTNPGRTDVLSEIDPEELLDAYLEVAGEPDPASVYFGRNPMTGLRQTVRKG